MRILEKPYTEIQFNQFVDECNKTGDLYIEKYDGNVYALHEYEVIQNGNILDLRETKEYQARISTEQKEIRTQEILFEMEELDKKRIRAICEPDILRDDGTSWLKYYNELIENLRVELNSL